MTDESEYTVPPKPVEPERRRLFVKIWRDADEFRNPMFAGWGDDYPATRTDIEAWCAHHGLALVTADIHLPKAIQRAEKAESRAALAKASLANLRDCIECHLAGFTPEDGAGHCQMVIAASHEVQRQVDAARDAEDERDRAVERAKVAEADRDRLARAVARYHGASRDHRHQTCGYCDALDALPEHIRREL